MINDITNSEYATGFENEKRWVRGTIPVGKGQFVYLDTRKGLGVEEILVHLHKFVTYQASKVRFPAYSTEDIIQEIQMLALEAIPKYDITRNSNMITFLQNHIKNRIINLCKFVSEKRRRATYYSVNQCKIKCPDCNRFTKIYQETKNFICQSCYRTAPGNDPSWKKYNLPVVPISFGTIEAIIDNGGEDTSANLTEVLSDNNVDLAFLRGPTLSLDDKIEKRLDFLKIYDKLDEVNKNIIKMVIEGYTYKDIAKKVGISEKAAYARASKIIKGQNKA
jgi:RNA polymerase sigma factor (sigma-70 family)